MKFCSSKSCSKPNQISDDSVMASQEAFMNDQIDLMNLINKIGETESIIDNINVSNKLIDTLKFPAIEALDVSGDITSLIGKKPTESDTALVRDSLNASKVSALESIMDSIKSFFAKLKTMVGQRLISADAIKRESSIYDEGYVEDFRHIKQDSAVMDQCKDIVVNVISGSDYEDIVDLLIEAHKVLKPEAIQNVVNKIKSYISDGGDVYNLKSAIEDPVKLLGEPKTDIIACLANKYIGTISITLDRVIDMPTYAKALDKLSDYIDDIDRNIVLFSNRIDELEKLLLTNKETNGQVGDVNLLIARAAKNFSQIARNVMTYRNACVVTGLRITSACNKAHRAANNENPLR